MTIFEQVKALTDIKDVARKYGIEITRHSKALCPFHSEKTASLSFKGQRFRCFGCGAGGSSIDLVAQLHNVSPLEAVKVINNDFGLRLDVSGKATPEVRRQLNKRQAERDKVKEIREWHNNIWTMLCSYNHWLNDLSPFDIRRHNIGYVNHLLDYLFNATGYEKVDFYYDKKVREELRQIERTFRNVGGSKTA